mmetsp:Transcript_1068/g.2565  ORF Transcript_1068/g.2565 Transcript_1068/m.2565 type:complete len:141 (-) Transcript_1068:106-528(-)
MLRLLLQAMCLVCVASFGEVSKEITGHGLRDEVRISSTHRHLDWGWRRGIAEHRESKLRGQWSMHVHAHGAHVATTPEAGPTLVMGMPKIVVAVVIDVLLMILVFSMIPVALQRCTWGDKRQPRQPPARSPASSSGLTGG